ncbi:MAG: DUF3987 domain-containing protein [Alphaproteobacteria bacterium]|nr:DUF3987 domain-containing protein [Alphaproteobacteria bacterium]
MSDMEMTSELRRLVWESGFRPVPVYNNDASCNAPGKQPKGTGWLADARLNPPAAAISLPTPDALNIGILCDGLRAVDIDVDDPLVAGKIDDLASTMLGAAPTRFRANSGRCLRVYRALDGEPPKRVLKGANDAKVEVLGKGQQFVGFWTHPSGAPLDWRGGVLGIEVRRDQLSPIGEEQISAFFEAAGALIGSPPVPVQPAPPAHGIRNADADDDKLLDIEAALDVIPEDGGDYDLWLRVGMAVHAGTGGGTQGLALWDSWSRKSPKYDGKAVADTWRSLSPSSITVGTLFHHAKEARPGWRAPSWNNNSQQDAADTPSLALLNRSMQPSPTLPIAVFGPVWSEWLINAAAGANAPVDYTALPLLAAASTLIGNARWVRAWDGWAEPPVLWCGAVGDPSSGKSPGAAPIMRDVIKKVETWMSRDYPDERDEWLAKSTASAAIEKQWEKDIATAAENGTPIPPKPPGIALPPAPVEPCARVGSVTIEKLAAILAAQPKGVLCSNDELANWLLNLNRYSGGGSDRPFWLESYVGGPYRVDRVKAPEPIRIPHLSVGLFGTIQPDKLAAALTGADDGLPSRFLWSWPEARPFARPKTSANIQAATDALCRLADLTMVQEEDGTMAPSFVGLADDALDTLEAFVRRLQVSEQDAFGLMKGTLGKARGQTLRIALVLQYLWWCTGTAAEPQFVQKRALEAAINLMESYFLPMAIRVFGDAGIPIEERNARTLANWIVDTRPQAINVSKIRDDARLPGLRESGDVKAACRFLLEARWLIDAPNNGGPGRPPGNYLINPKLWDVLPAR